MIIRIWKMFSTWLVYIVELYKVVVIDVRIRINIYDSVNQLRYESFDLFTY